MGKDKKNTNDPIVLNEVYTLIYDLHNYGLPLHYTDDLPKALVWMCDNLEQDDFDILFDFIYGVSKFESGTLLKHFDCIFNKRKMYPMYDNFNTCFLQKFGLKSRDYERGVRKSMIVPLKHFKLKGVCLLETSLNNKVMECGVSDKLFSAYKKLCLKYKESEPLVENRDDLLNVAGVPETYKIATPFSGDTLYRMVKFHDAYGRITDTVTDLNHISIKNCKSLEGMFSTTNHFLNTDSDDKSDIFKFINQTKWIYNIDSWDVSGVSNMRNVFRYAKYVPQCVSRWDVGKVEIFAGAFRNAKGVPDISSWNTESVSDMSEMFYGVTTVPDISKWNVGRVSRMECTFANVRYIPDISMWDVSSVVCMDRAFKNSNITSELSRWNVKNVISFIGMFENSFFSVDTDFTDWDVSNGVQFSCMFKNSGGHLWVESVSSGRRSGLSGMARNCVPISIDVSAWDVSNAVYMESMFEGSDFATDLSGWNVGNVLDATSFDKWCECNHKNPCFKCKVV